MEKYEIKERWNIINEELYNVKIFFGGKRDEKIENKIIKNYECSNNDVLIN